MDDQNAEEPPAELTPELLRISANLASQMAMISLSTITCELHEHCDGSCSGNGPVMLEPLQVGHNPYGARVQDRPVFDLPLVQEHPTEIPTECYQYTPIDSVAGEIRVLRLREAIFRSDPVVVELVTINITEAERPDFAALSYHWGKAVFNNAIVCDGKRLNVNASLLACLTRHRGDWLEKPEYLWVDAICINQEDKDELNQQLPLMGDIYRGAVMVFVDFGNVQMEWYVAYDLMLRVQVVRKMLKDRIEDLVSEGLQERVGLPSFSHVAWRNFTAIFMSPWLERTWTIQEVVLAKQIRCRYGRFNFGWDDLVSLAHLMSLQRVQSRQLVDGVLPSQQMIGMLNLDRILRIRLEFQAGRLRPMQLLWRTRDCKVSNDRDKVVGLLGMLVPTLTRDKFQPDYTWPTEKLFYHFAKYVLRNFHFRDRAALLSFAGLSRRRKPSQNTPEANCEPPLPSWVPDWLVHDSAGAAVFSIIREKSFNASKGTLPVMYPLGEYGTEECFITQTGYSLGKISSLTKPRHELKIDIAATPANELMEGPEPTTSQPTTNMNVMRKVDLEWLQWHNDAEKVLEDAISNGQLSRYEQPRTAFAFTLLAGDDYKGANATVTTVPIENPELSLAAVIADIASPDPTLHLGSMNPDSLYKSQAAVACRDRHFAVTEAGYVGLVPTCSQTGDEIFLLGGVSTPFVLRQKSERKFALVGDSYIHGVMEGEIAEGLQTDDWTPVFIY
ncbi:heterokaryon incompatibility protein-domain-containing protein [Cadophora sp. MPI-SDFR-AT-0126]|nr:heterokaryon incompatibility protein-domain-containing protein [Leotiomycetes sp. MPI-SDFR-AT-0126]